MGDLHFWVNGKEQTVSIEAGEMLSDVLRYRLDLTGTKVSCNESECGACTIHVDGLPVLSCTYPAQKAAGKRITTIEGLANNGALHPLQEAFVKHGAVQCGFCTPGMLLTAKVLLDENPEPTEREVRRYLSGNLCRCTGYSKIIEAVLDAAEEISRR